MAYVGVTSVGRRWKASASHQGYFQHLGMFSTAEEAARAYDTFRLQHPCRRARLNFAMVPWAMTLFPRGAREKRGTFATFWTPMHSKRQRTAPSRFQNEWCGAYRANTSVGTHRAVPDTQHKRARTHPPPAPSEVELRLDNEPPVGVFNLPHQSHGLVPAPAPVIADFGESRRSHGRLAKLAGSAFILLCRAPCGAV